MSTPHDVNNFMHKHINAKKTGANMRKFRKELGLTADYEGELLGVTGCAVYRWERGEAIPETSKISDICDVLGKTFEEIFAYEIEEESE